MGKRNVVLSFLKVLEKWIKCWLKQIEAAIHVGRMWGKIYSFILQSVWGELEETELSQGCLPGHRGSCLNLQISKVFLFLFFLYFCSNGGFDATEQILALFQSLYILMLVVHHAPAQELTCSSLNMHPQHAYQQPSPPPALLHIICLIYCMPLTNCQRPIPLLQMSIDQSTSMAVEKVYSLTHTLIFLLPLVSQKLTEKGEFQKRREKKSIELEVKRSKVQTAWRI